MQLKSILNRVEKTPGFVFKECRWNESGTRIEVVMEPRKNARARCSRCGKVAVLYDRQRVRAFDYVPLWQIPVVLLYAMRRVKCRSCGVCIERVPWASGKNHVSTTYLWFLAVWASRLSWKEVAETFGATWQTVCRGVEQAVGWGREHMQLDGIRAIGVDEILHRRGSKAHGGPKYLTLIYQIDNHRKRLLWIGYDRSQATLNAFFDWFGQERSGALKVVCSDMWPAYLKVLAERATNAMRILDRFHVSANLNKAIDRIRAGEARRLGKRSNALVHSRFLFLHRRENLSEPQHEKLAAILKMNLTIVRAYLLKESFSRLWSYRSRGWARRFLDGWIDRVMRSKIEGLKRIAKTFRRHTELILNSVVTTDVARGAVEGFNNKAKVTIRKSYGFRSFRIAELALYHSLADLPQPNFTHRFW
jgi:transposase